MTKNSQAQLLKTENHFTKNNRPRYLAWPVKAQ
jgi:hypothetical protein